MVLLTEADFANLSLLRYNPDIARLLDCATVVASDAMPPDIVTMNTQVVLRDEATGERHVVRVVFPDDADPAAGCISVLDPVGIALLGASPRHAIRQRLRIERVIYQPEDSLRAHLVTRR